MQITTERAKEAMNDMMKDTPNSASSEDRGAILLNAAVQYVLDSPNHSDDVGGAIDILVLPKSRPSSWKKIKPECERGDQIKKR
jgi:hypothetical protein